MFRASLLFTVCVTILLASVTVTWGRELIKNEKCAICHIYDSAYFDSTISEEKIELDLGEKKNCMSCHNGSVVDSRDTLLSGYQHPRVNNSGKGLHATKKRGGKECTYCHTPHTKLGWRGFAGEDISIYTGGDRLCRSCHPRYVYSPEKSNHYYERIEGCLSCHTLHGAATKTLLRGTYKTVCETCHKTIFEVSKKKKGHPVGRFKKKPVILTKDFSLEHAVNVNLDCNICHAIHEGRESGVPKAMSADSHCRECHKGFIGGGKGSQNNGNHPASAGCTDCHAVHGKDTGGGGKGIGSIDMKPLILCRQCHEDRFGGMDRRKPHTLDKGKLGESACLTCHSMHGGILTTPNLVSERDEICVDCHSEYNTINEVISKPMAHKIFSTVFEGTAHSKIDALGGKLGKHEEIICRSCHSVHSPGKDNLLVAEKVDLCKACHEEHELNHGKSITECTECHFPHGVDTIEAGIGKEPNSRICSSCHGVKGMHSFVGPQKMFPNPGNFPLFDTKGRKSTRGYMGCSSCHEIHGGEEEQKYLRKNFSGSTFLCLSCHIDKEKISLTPHDLRGIASNNLCEPCHVPHGGDDNFMWGLPKGEKVKQTGYCDPCHGEGGMASKIEKGKGHPVNTIPQKKEGVPFTFFDTMWYEHELGMMTCPTCHDIHGESVTFEEERRKGLLALTHGSGEKSRYLGRENFCIACHIDKKEMGNGFHGQYGCEECHQPHKAPVPPENVAGYSWPCLACHKDVPKKDAPVFKFLGKEITGNVNASEDAPLFDEMGKRSTRGAVSCPSCHNVHSSTKSIDRAFQGSTEDETCFACHPEKREFKASAHDLSEGTGTGCKTCHGVCAEDLPSQELQNTIISFSVNPSDGNCLYCHSQNKKEGFSLFHPKKKKKVTSTYGAVMYVESDFHMESRTSGVEKLDFPLFDQKGSGGREGVLGCMTCHDPHRKNKIEGKKNTFLRDESGFFVSNVCEPCHGGDSEKLVREYHYMKREEE